MKTKLTLFVTVLTAALFVGGCASSSINKGLVAYYPFDGHTKDESGSGNHSTAQNNPQWVNDAEKGSCTRLVSRGEYGPEGSHFLIPDLPVGSWEAITMSIWLKEETIDLQTGGQMYLGLGTLSQIPPKPAFGIGMGGDPLQLRRVASGGRHDGWDIGGLVWDKPPADYRNRWVHHVQTVEATGSKFYANGELIDSTTKAGLYATLAGQYKAGYSAIGRNWWRGGIDTCTRYTGKVDDVRIYNRALSDGEVKALYDLEKPKGK